MCSSPGPELSFSLWLLALRGKTKGLKRCLMFKCTGCCCRRSKLSSQLPHGSSQLFITPVPEDLTPSHRHTWRQNTHDPRTCMYVYHGLKSLSRTIHPGQEGKPGSMSEGPSSQRLHMRLVLSNLGKASLPTHCPRFPSCNPACHKAPFRLCPFSYAQSSIYPYRVSTEPEVPCL